MSDPLDDLLDRSAPPLADRGHTRDAALRQMVSDARDTVRPRKIVRRRRVVLGGVLAAALVGGAGVAAANSDWSWTPGLENPDRSYTYTSPRWGKCEIRFSGYDIQNPLVKLQVDRIVDEWFATVDVEAAAAPLVPKYIEQLESDQVASADPIADPRLADLNAWTAHEQALAEIIYEELKAHGYDSADLAGSTGHSQLHCEHEDWGGGGGEL